MTATGTLSGLAPGSYTVTAESVSGPSSIVPVVYDATVTGSPVTVSADATATASVSYAAQAGTGTLWVGNPAADGPLLVGYTAAQLAASTSAPPAIVLTASQQPVPGGVSGAAFDQDGNLWVADPVNNTVSKYTAAQLATGGAATPAVVLSPTTSADYPYLTSLSKPAALAFDASGNVWVANNDVRDYTPTIVEFASTQLVTSGAPAPVVTLSGGGCSSARFYEWCDPTALAFDPSGNLWVTAPDKASVMMLPASQLVPGGSGAPAVALWGSTPGAYALAFDAAGNLWVSCARPAGSFFEAFYALLAFTPDQLAATGQPELTVTQPEPTVKLRGTETALSSPRGLAFDASGNLWVANFGGNSILEFTASQLASSGAPVPNVVVGTTLAPAVLAFNPHAANLPLK